jgi:CrcB protein
MLLVVVGGAAGAISRYYAERWAVRRFHERVPWGTALANLGGAAVLGVIAGLAHRGTVSQDVLLLIGTGYCGALTTFSGFMGQIETRLRHKATRLLAVQYGIGVVAAGIVIAGVAYRLTA